jgi:hypothetical protein
MNFEIEENLQPKKDSLTLEQALAKIPFQRY